MTGIALCHVLCSTLTNLNAEHKMRLNLEFNLTLTVEGGVSTGYTSGTSRKSLVYRPEILSALLWKDRHALLYIQ
ncbi:hypothetical protein SCTVLC_0804 [Serratia symbiotica SCt-VLC]|uniref:Uncharacterized protein n=1 Tax=Serratia symbiotica SCt-VLC TaxID=1347341 RepID=A0A068RA15_9GAMM|nr:hypothetical protein SCTVLC_0804 [Serratia symbiotica SCt-VLC]